MSVIVITGANRGIGLSLASQCKAQGHKVVALCRTQSEALCSLDVNVLEGVDVSAPEGLPTLSARIRALGISHIDILINNAGILMRQTLDQLNYSDMRAQFEVNALGPLKIIESLSSLLAEGSKVINITSRMGSIEDNTSGGSYGYRMSKAALNMATMSLAHDLKQRGAMACVIHPGYVRTGMTGQRGLIEPDESAAGIIERVKELTMENTGSFWHSNGERLPW